MNLGSWLMRQAQLNPDRPALFSGHEQVADYAGFHDRAARLAGWLGAQGVQRGDRVAIFMKNCPDYLIAQYGIWYVGAVAVPINAKLHAREAAFIVENSGAGLCFTSAGLGEGLGDCRVVAITSNDWADAMAHDPVAGPVTSGADELCWLFYTSGTTGRPKGVRITNRMLVTMSLAYHVDVDRVTSQDAAIYAAPMSHGAGIYNMVHVQAGARHVCPASGGFDPAEILDLARHFGAAHMFAAPTMVKRLTDAAKASGENGQGLRSIVYGGGPMYVADIIAAVDHFGPVFIQIYGQGECPMGISALSRDEVADRERPGWRERLASVGRAQAPMEIRIGDSDGNALPPGAHGEIIVRGDIAMPGYWNDDAADAKALRDGWLLTGDMGFMDEAGYVTMQDRSKDMIITGGSNVYPREVEEVLLTHPGVSEVSVVGRAHPDWGEEVIAFVVGDASPPDLDRLCNDNIARFKRPKQYFFLPELPKNNYGKVLKTELRQMLKEMT